MPTGDTWVNLVLKRFLSHTRLRSNFFSYLKELTLDLGSRIFPSSGLFTFPVAITQSTTDFDLSISPPGDIEGIDDEGHVLVLETSRQTNIPYENDPTFNYWIGLHYTSVPEDIISNPRTGVPEYDKWRDEVGEKDNPNSVTDLGSGVIRLQVDSIFQAGVDHSGRQVMVWLNDPMSADDTVAIELATVFYSGGNNYIDTVGSLGQGTVSTNVGDYSVACLGVTIRKNATDPFDSSYVLIGYITGHAVTPTHNADGQADLSGGGGHTLQRAYDGLAGSGSGRIITVADDAVQLRQSSSAEKSEDLGNAVLRARKDLNTALPGAGFEFENALDLLSRFNNWSSIWTRKQIADFGTYADGTDYDQCRIEEACDITAVDQITLTRAGVDLNFDLCQYSQIRTTFGQHYVEVYDSPTPSNDGLYRINLISPVSPAVANIVTLRGIDNSVPALTLEAGAKCRFYHGTVRIDMDGAYTALFHSPVDFYREAFGNQTHGWMGNDFAPAFNGRNEWIDFGDVGTTRRVTFTGAETTINDYITAINAVLVDSRARDVGGEVRIDTLRTGSTQTITLVGSQTANIVIDVFGTATPTQVTGTDDTNGLLGQGVLEVAAINPEAADYLARFAAYDLITPVVNEIRMLANGGVDADGYLRSAGSDIFAPTGRLSVLNNVTSQVGDVEALVGDVTAADDVTAGDEVRAVNNIESSLGDLRADQGEVYAGVDFRYYLTKSFEYVIPLNTGEPTFDITGSAVKLWLFDPGAAANAPVWISNGNVGGPINRYLSFGFRLPHGATITAVAAIATKVTATDLYMALYRRTNNWTTGPAGTPGVIGGPVDTTGWGAGVTSVLSITGLTEVIDQNREYYVRFLSPDLNGNPEITGVRISFDLLYLRP
jgi:hypothetical protein